MLNLSSFPSNGAEYMKGILPASFGILFLASPSRPSLSVLVVATDSKAESSFSLGFI
jgi:hypothetical protein